VEYVLFIDGSTVLLEGTAPTADHQLAATMDAIAKDVVCS
jgi:hypothetical protein